MAEKSNEITAILKVLESIGMEKKTIRKEETEKEEYRYYISSLCKDIELFSRAVKGHWAVESMHQHSLLKN